LVFTDRLKLVAGLVMETLASITGAPALSLTVPVIEPLLLCPNPAIADNEASAKIKINRYSTSLAIISASY
jgi:hypothetical protein